MTKEVAFGIGCFHFGVKKPVPMKFKPKEYKEELQAVLQGISNIKDINIYPEKFEDYSIIIRAELPDIEKGYDFFPRIFFMNVKFEIYIPFKVQAELLEEEIRWLRTFTEKFRISIYYPFYSPVAFVEPVHPSEECVPSEAVQIVREFLKKQLDGSKSEYIQFEFLGPSPFHAECYIRQGKNRRSDGLRWKFEYKCIHRRGYDNIMFYFNPKLFKNAEEAKEKIFEEIADEIGLFYKMEGDYVIRSREWRRINNLVSELISIQKMKWPKNFFKKVFTFMCSGKINEAFISIAEFEKDELFFNNITQTEYRNMYFEGRQECFKYHIDKLMKERLTYPTDQMNRLIRFFESWRLKAFDILALLFSAIIGGTIGALVTLLIAK